MENRLEHNAPLMQVNYELQIPTVVFIPNLDTSSGNGLMNLIDEIIIDIYSMCDMIPRIAQPLNSEEDGVSTYECKYWTHKKSARFCITNLLIAVLRNEKLIEEMRDDIVRQTKTSAANATAYVTKFNIYEAHWTTNREKYLQQFILYSRVLTEEEEISEAEETKIRQIKPTLDQYRAQVN